MILCRYGEVFLKGQNREWFLRRLERNVIAQLEGVPGSRTLRPHGRLLVEADDVSAAVSRLERCFGLSSMSPTTSVAADMAAIEAAAFDMARAEWERRGKRGTFRVEARRQDKRFPFRSPEIEQRIGGRIHTELGIPVKLTKPDWTLGVEVGLEGRAFLYSTVIPGAGGLPVGTAGHVLALLSGGIDSPVAAWMMAKRGAKVSLLYFHSPPYTSQAAHDKVVDLAKALTPWIGRTSLSVVTFTDVQKQLREAGPPELAVVLYRRMMLRVAEKVARNINASALATGDQLAQVASQTLENLATVGEATSMALLRPLVGLDKRDSIALAERIGTYDISIRPFEDCCSLFVPKHPATAARLAEVKAVEARLDLPALTCALESTLTTIRLP